VTGKQTKGLRAVARRKNRSKRYSRRRTFSPVYRRPQTRRSLHANNYIIRRKVTVRRPKLKTRRVITKKISSPKKTHTLLPLQNQVKLKKAIICARRKIRKEVIFAKNKNGAGNSRPTYTERSKVKC
jgi:hypothetical protein